MADLFGFVTRDERQAQCLQAWKAYKGKGTVEACTGFGKTRIGTNLITKLVEKHPKLRVLVVVPTITLKEQWTSILDGLGLALNCEVVVINTAITKEWKVDLLVIDEAHRAAAAEFQKVFEVVHYKLILCLTATLERLDGHEAVIKKYAPVCDRIPIELALFNNWVSQYKEYQVIIHVDDIDIYKRYQKEFTSHFEFFNHDFNLAMAMIGKDGLKNRLQLRDEMCPFNGYNQEQRKEVLRDITYHATAFSTAMQARKGFIHNHPKKLDIVRKIIEARPFAKIITFAKSVKMAEAVGIGKVYSGKDSKKKGRATIEEFKNGDFKVLNTIEKANEGLDVPGLSVAIQFGIDSSSIKAIQRLGRCIRYEAGKQAEMFTIVIEDTQEVKWFSESHKKQTNYITIDEQGLEDVLAGKEPKPYSRPLKNFTFRY